MPSAPLRLRCEFANNPLGVARRNPRLSWWVNDPRPAELQTAYEIMAASSLVSLDEGEADLWYSGRIETDESGLVEYGGPPVRSGQRIWWKVRTFDSDGMTSPWSEPAHFQIGLLDESDWQAHWIGSQLHGSRARGVHAVALRRAFELPARLRTAQLYVCALGDYRVEINGRALPGVELNGVWSDFDQVAYYQVFDAADLLHHGQNCIGLLLSDGYFSGALPGLDRCVYGDRPLVRVKLCAILDNGDQFVLTSDRSWYWRPSWILAAGVNEGEHVDARQLVADWSEPGCDAPGWQSVQVAAAPERELRAQEYAAFAVQRSLRPLRPPTTSQSHRDGRWFNVYDFGDDIVGRVDVQLESMQSDNILLEYALDDDFSDVTVDSFTSSIDSERFTGQFALHTFRYLRIGYAPQATSLGDVHAKRITAYPALGVSLRSDHSSLNELFDALLNSLQSVAMSVPMRGASIERRSPDDGYAATWVPFYAQQVVTRPLVNKWLADWRDTYRREAGRADDDAPAGDVDEFARFESYATTLWALYRAHNDVHPLRAGYPDLRVAALSYRHRYEGLLRISPPRHLYGDGDGGAAVATCCLYSALRTVARIAGVLAKLGDYERIETLAEDVRSAFRRRFLSRDGHLMTDCQSVYVAALYHDMLDDSERALAQQRLVQLLQAANYHADLAPAIVRGLLPVLTQAGRLDMAYLMLLQTSAPSWLSVVNRGGRLIGYEPGEFDIAQVGLLEWLMESLVGLKLHEDYSVGRNGYKTVRVCPKPPFGAQFLAGSPVERIEASLDTCYGQYVVNWRITAVCFELELQVPPGCTALVTMPDEIEQRVSSGHHRFVMDFGAGGDGVPTLLDLAGEDLADTGTGR